jgi:primosomal replication protein N
MAGVNRVILIGNLGKDPEIRSLEGGVKVANFSLATTESYKGKNGEKVDQTEWHNIVLWRGLAEVAENYLKKGNSIYVEGKIRTRDWTDKTATNDTPPRSLPIIWLCSAAGGISPITVIIHPISRSRKNRHRRKHPSRMLI